MLCLRLESLERQGSRGAAEAAEEAEAGLRLSSNYLCMSDDSSLLTTYITLYTTYQALYGHDTCILLQVGKFYELYDTLEEQTSMKRAATLMNIAIRTKPTSLFAGVPEQSLHKFAQVLTTAGWTVVVVDQVKDSTNTVIARIPARILSPGTHVETATNERMSIAAIHAAGRTYTASVVDLMTGEVFSFETESAHDISHMLQVYSVKEVVTSSTDLYSRLSIQSSLTSRSVSAFDSAVYREDYLRKAFHIQSLLPVRATLFPGAAASESIEISLCLAISYMEDHFPTQVNRLGSHSIYTPSKYMRINGTLLEQLNISSYTNPKKSILCITDKTYSAIGKRAMRERILRPITSPTELQRRWAQVAWAISMDAEKKDQVIRDLKGMYDIPRLHYRVAAGTTTANDIAHMFQSYSHTACLLENLANTPLAAPLTLDQSFRTYRSRVRDCLDEHKALNENYGFLTDQAGPKTAAIEQQIQRSYSTWNSLWLSYCGSVGVPCTSSTLTVNDDGTYSLECPRTYYTLLEKPTTKLKGLSVEKKKSGPLLVTCQDLDSCVREVVLLRGQLRASLRIESLIVFDSLWEDVRVFQNSWIQWLGRIDCTVALASVATAHGWTCPTVGEHLSIQGLRHPLIEGAQTRVEYVKHDVCLGTGAEGRGWLLYGVNASGKSSLMKAVGIAVLLAQAGSFVPADSMSIKPYDSAFTRIWNTDNIWAGLSSFAVEVTELRDILENATENSLILGDEVCSGTESLSATSLVTGILEHLDSIGAHFIFATHLHDLQKVLSPATSIRIFHLRVTTSPSGKLLYDRTLQPGSGSPTYGLEVARAMGIPLAILERAHAVRKVLGRESNVATAAASTWNSEIRRYECEVCGTKITDSLEVHHIVERCKNDGYSANAPRNLVVLCMKCHDDTHSGVSVVGPLQQTSEGIERSIVSTPAKKERKGHEQWTEDEMTIITSTVATYAERPVPRILAALQEAGIRMTAAQLKKYR
jgi:DNA mismatch repair protein MutS